ncbi:hypothetical protein ACSBR2_030345 [Camellia fascicularis]
MRQGGWIPLVRQRRGQGRGMIEGSKSFFTRKKLASTRFGFVRFDCSVAAKVAVQKANGLWVHNMEIEVKHAAFGKEKVGGQGVTGPVRLQVTRYNGYQREGRSWVGVSTDQRSYAEVVIGKCSVGKDIITLKAEEIGNGWLYKSVVVRLKDKYANVNLKKELEGIGMEDVMIIESGGRDVVLTFKSKKGMERCVWISCYGIPLNLWNSTNLRRIGGLWGNFLCFDGDSDYPKSFACAKLKISTKCMEPINKVVKLDCKGLLYPLRVCEEQVVMEKTMSMVCKCQKDKVLEEKCSSNDPEKQGMRRSNSEEEEEDDMEDDSDYAMELRNEVVKVCKACGQSKSEEVEQVLGGKSVTEVA